MKLGEHWSEGQRTKFTLTRTGHSVSPETREKLSKANMGHITPVEQRMKQSAALKGITRSPETRAKMGAAKVGNTFNLGRLVSIETRVRISISNKGRKCSPETRAKLSEAMAGPKSSRWKGGERVSAAKHKAKRRLLGFHPLNSWFEGSDGHHLNQIPGDVIYIPEAMHDSVKHDIWTGRGMEKINALASKFLMEGWT